MNVCPSCSLCFRFFMVIPSRPISRWPTKIGGNLVANERGNFIQIFVCMEKCYTPQIKAHCYHLKFARFGLIITLLETNIFVWQVYLPLRTSSTPLAWIGPNLGEKTHCQELTQTSLETDVIQIPESTITFVGGFFLHVVRFKVKWIPQFWVSKCFDFEYVVF